MRQKGEKILMQGESRKVESRRWSENDAHGTENETVVKIQVCSLDFHKRDSIF